MRRLLDAGHARVRRARLPRGARRRHRARRAHVARHLLPVLREQGRPAARARDRVRAGDGRARRRARPGRRPTPTGYAELRRSSGSSSRPTAATGRSSGRGWRATSRTATSSALGVQRVHRHRDRARPAHARGGRARRRRVDLRAHGAARTLRVLPRVAPPRVRHRRDCSTPSRTSCTAASSRAPVAASELASARGESPVVDRSARARGSRGRSPSSRRASGSRTAPPTTPPADDADERGDHRRRRREPHRAADDQRLQHVVLESAGRRGRSTRQTTPVDRALGRGRAATNGTAPRKPPICGIGLRDRDPHRDAAARAERRARATR